MVGPESISHLVVVLSHHDDESLFVGGLLLERSHLGLPTVLITVCDYSVENNLEEGPQEDLRRQNRAKAYQRSTQTLHLSPIELKVALNIQADSPEELCLSYRSQVVEKLTELWAVLRGDYVVLTHPATGPIEHPNHTQTHRAVLEVFDDRPILVYGDENAPIQHPVDLEGKRRLLANYREGTTRTAQWDPFGNSIYAPWCRSQEGYEWHGVHPWMSDGSKESPAVKQVVDLLAGQNTSRSLLDVGTGNGALLKHLRERGWTGELLGIDFEPYHASFARWYCGEPVLAGDFQKMDLGHRFDVVVALGWLHNDWAFKHALCQERLAVPREDRYVQLAHKFAEVLLPGGLFIFDSRDEEYQGFEQSLRSIGWTIKAEGELRFATF